MQEDLKSREIDILRLMAEGLTNREIAERLYIGVETVRWYAKQIYSKLYVSGRKEAANKAQKLGLLDKKLQSGEQPKTSTKHNLPTQLTSFIGREKQIAEIIELLSETRLLTLTGPGGTGKTRLSLKVAKQMLDNFADGVYFIDLAPTSNSDRVANTIAHSLGINESGDEPIVETLKRAIGHREILLLLDNYEHVIEAALLVSDLLSSTSNIKIIVTSREALRVSGEQIYPVPTMLIFESDNPSLSEALTLFAQRAQAVKPRFQVDKDNTNAVVEICQRLDGMPLAIELAAVQSRFLTPDAILSRLNNRLQSLKSGLRDAPRRQQTLQATIDWSYELLEEGEKILFARMAIFRGGRSLETIKAVCGDNLPIDVFDGLAALVDKSMIRQIEDELGEPRFVMLETLQEYALQKLVEFDETKAMQRRHAQHFMELAEHAAPELRLAHQEWWYTRLDIEQNNLRAAMTWALSGEDAEIGIRTVAALRDYWYYQGWHGEGWRWIEQAMEFIESVSDKIRADLLLAASLIGYMRHEETAFERFAAQALSLYQTLDNPHGITWSMILLAYANSIVSDGITMLKDALKILQSLEDLPGQAQLLTALGIYLTYMVQDYEQAETAFKDCINITRQTGETRREVMALAGLQIIAFQKRQITKAQKLAIKSISLARNLHFRQLLHEELWSIIPLFMELDKLEVAITIFAAVETQERLTGQLIYPTMVKLLILPIEQLKTLIHESPAYQVTYEAGRKMTLEEAVEFALQELGEE